MTILQVLRFCIFLLDNKFLHIPDGSLYATWKRRLSWHFQNIVDRETLSSSTDACTLLCDSTLIIWAGKTFTPNFLCLLFPQGWPICLVLHLFMHRKQPLFYHDCVLKTSTWTTKSKREKHRQRRIKQWSILFVCCVERGSSLLSHHPYIAVIVMLALSEMQRIILRMLGIHGFTSVLHALRSFMTLQLLMELFPHWNI